MTEAPIPMRNIVGVRFAPNGRTVEFDAGSLDLARGETVVVEDRQGGEVAVVSVAAAARSRPGRLSRVLRRADERDLVSARDRDRQVAEALSYARRLVRERHLPMKVFRVEMPRGTDRATFYFSSEERVDFRDLVRDLGSRVHARIELRQVGVRDEAKMVGAIGSCGQELCCSTFLPRFAPVSIKMAKVQNLPLNPSKVTGQCGRLKCCLVYEEAMYVEAAKNLPKVGKKVETPEGVGRVDDLSVLLGKIRVSFPGKPPQVFTADQLRWTMQPGPDPLVGPSE